MLNWIWLGMIVLSLFSAMLFSRMQAMTDGIINAAEFTINFMLPQAGFMCLWMGILRLVEKSGMITIISRILSPVLRFLFPGIPAGHPALGAIALNLGANMLGAGNAATPAGLRAMQHMQSLNPHKQVATNEMCMLLAMSTAVITLIPAGSIRALHAVQSSRSTEVILPSFLTTVFATIIAVIACKLLQRRTIYTPTPEDIEAAATESSKEAKPAEAEIVAPESNLHLWQKIVLGVFVFIPLISWLWYVVAPNDLAAFHTSVRQFIGNGPEADPKLFGSIPPSPVARYGQFFAAMTIPMFIGYFVLHAAFAKVKVFEEFVEGAKDGFHVIVRILPYVAGIFVAVRMMRESGVMGLLQAGLNPLMGWLHFPTDVVPMALIRPLSGSAAQAVLADIATTSGPNTMSTMIAATINGSADTTFYIIAVYFGSVGIKKLRHAVAAGLIGDLAVMIGAVVICNALLN